LREGGEKVKIANPVIGEVEFKDSDVIQFPEGMLGLPDFKRYILVSNPNIKPFMRLQCVDEGRISFLAVDPAIVDPAYFNYVASQDSGRELIKSPEETVLLVVCNLQPKSNDITANLQAPVVLNYRNMAGVQIVLLDSPYGVRHSLVGKARREA
jgi:flagellar assembly factor FliW